MKKLWMVLMVVMLMSVPALPGVQLGGTPQEMDGEVLALVDGVAASNYNAGCHMLKVPTHNPPPYDYEFVPVCIEEPGDPCSQFNASTVAILDDYHACGSGGSGN